MFDRVAPLVMERVFRKQESTFMVNDKLKNKDRRMISRKNIYKTLNNKIRSAQHCVYLSKKRP